MHYYREVLRSGHLGPNDVWYHFHLSKGAGLFFLAGILGDPLSAQLVSSGCMMMAGLVVFHAARTILGRTAWGLVGAALFFGFVAADESRGAFFKHHAVFASFVTFLALAAFEFLRHDGVRRRVLYIATCVVSGYIGFYQPAASSLLLCGLVFLALATSVPPAMRPATRAFFVVAIVMAIGMGLDALVNHVYTGMAGVMPARIFWQIGDQARFEEVYGNSGLVYLLYMDNDMRSTLDTSGAWLSRVLRIGYFGFLIRPLLVLLAASAVVVRWIRKPATLRPTHSNRALLVAAAFFIPSVVFAQFVQLDSTARLFIFTGFFTTLLGLALVWLVVETFMSEAVRRGIGSLMMVLLAMTAVARGFDVTRKHARSSLAFLTGKKSTAQLVRDEMGDEFQVARLEFMTQVRRKIGPMERVLTLEYSPVAYYSLPGAGLVSEPTYTLGPEFLEIVFGTPERAEELLRQRGINFFHVDTRKIHGASQLFSSLAFSNLFRPDVMNRHFMLVLEVEGNCLLTWRQSLEADPLPPLLLRSLDLRRSAVFFFPFDSRFSDLMTSAARQAINEAESLATEAERADYIQRQIESSMAQILREGMLDRTCLEENEALMKRVIDECLERLHRDGLELIQAALRLDLGNSVSEQEYCDRLCEKLTVEVVRLVQAITAKQCKGSFAPPLAYVLTHQDERIPFGAIYESRDGVIRIMEGDRP